jgi:hypothetical protein
LRTVVLVRPVVTVSHGAVSLVQSVGEDLLLTGANAAYLSGLGRAEAAVSETVVLV